MPTAVHGFSLTNLISTAVAPVVLISATAILWSGYANKYANLSDRLRDLAAEFRPRTRRPRAARACRPRSVCSTGASPPCGSAAACCRCPCCRF